MSETAARQTAALPAAIAAAAERLRPHVRRTWVMPSAPLSERGGAEVFLKLENLQHTGSFKLRGALNKLLSLDPAERRRGVVGASTGNHGAALAWGGRRLGVPVRIFVPEEASPSKLAAIEELGAELCRVPGDPVRAETAARRDAADSGRTFVSPYNDWQVVAGQGTVGWELARQCQELDAVYVALGGGGLIAGIAAWLESVGSPARIIGCSPANSPVMIESVRAGRIVEMPSLPTLSDGTAGGVEEDAITLPLCRRLVDDFVKVAEEEIAPTLGEFVESHHLVIEGAAAVAVAAYLATAERFAGGRVAIVVCGGNLSLERLGELLGSARVASA